MELILLLLSLDKAYAASQSFCIDGLVSCKESMISDEWLKSNLE